MMRSKDEAGHDPWIVSAKQSKLASFAAGSEADRNAVAAAIVEPWSSGQVEGRVNRLNSSSARCTVAPTSTCSKPAYGSGMILHMHGK